MDNDASVLITGAGGGIGTATTLRLAELGYTVYAGVRSAAPHLEGLPRVRVVRLDVTKPESVAEAAARIAEETAGLHAVVNNAGVIVQGPLELVPPSELHHQFDVNVYGPVLIVQAFLPLLRKGHGRVINISAATARTAVPFAGPISASKAALESLSDALRGELLSWTIPVVVVEPGAVDTAIFEKAEKAAGAALAQVPADRLALYGPALESVGQAMAKLKPAPAGGVVKTIVRAVRSPRPKPRYVAGRDAHALIALSHLPQRTRDRLLVRSLGLGNRR